MTRDAELVVALPERFDRRLRLGPFPSAQHALKFVSYAAIGGLVAVALGPLWWLPFLGIAALVALPPWTGGAPDRRCAIYLRWRLGLGQSPSASPAGGAGGRRLSGTVPVLPGRCVALVVAYGIPTRFLPIEDRRKLFEEYRDLLRSLQGGVVIVTSVEPLAARPFLPSRGSPTRSESERQGRDGYAEMVRLLCRRRFRRRVRWVLWADDSRSSLYELDRRAEALRLALRRLGSSAERVVGAELRQQLRSLGWPVEPGSG